MSKALAKMPGGDRFKGQKFELAQSFKNWRIDKPFDPSTFVFTPPANAKKVDDILAALAGGDGQGAQEGPSPLVGKPAPEISLKRLDDKGEFRLKDQRGKSVVMLDFWATWCGPCVQELPLLIEAAKEYKSKGVAFFALNQQEKPEVICEFLDAKKLDLTVALDTEAQAASAYGVQGIPMLVLVDKAGVVQSVHVGYSPAIKTTLRKELDAILAGKDLAKEAVADAKAAREKDEAAARAGGLEKVWTASGLFMTVSADASRRNVYASGARGRIDVLNGNGKTVRSINHAGDGMIVRVARLAAGAEGLLTFGVWGNTLVAAKPDGTTIWEEASPNQGIDDVWPADLDGDGADEVIVGYNGSTGLHLFSTAGKLLWKRTDLGNVWNVTAADLDGDGKPEVLCTSAQGKVHLTAPKNGHPGKTLSPGFYAMRVRPAPGRAIPGANAKADVAVVVGSNESGVGAMAALGGDGKVYWTVTFPAGTQFCDSVVLSPDGTLAAVGFQGGRVCVVDLRRGQIAAQATGQGRNPSVAWLTREGQDTPLLLVATGLSVNAFRVRPEPTVGAGAR
jgi:thiol-disulfide isomerase/thioredoxin